MLIRELTADHVYLACGRTDMRKRSLQHTAFKFKLCITSANLWIAQPASVLTSLAFCGIME